MLVPHRRELTAAELGAFLGLTASRVRHIVTEYGIQHIGRAGRAKLYDPWEVFEITGQYDRRKGKRRGGLTEIKVNAHYSP